MVSLENFLNVWRRLNTNSHSLFKNTEEEGTFPNQLMKLFLPWYQNQRQEKQEGRKERRKEGKKRDYIPTSLMNIDRKTHNKILANEIQHV